MPVQLTVISPQEREEIFGEGVTVRVITTGCVQGIDCQFLLWLDEKNPKAENAIFHKGNFDFVFQEVVPDKHKLRIEVVQKNGDSYKPPVIKEINFSNQAFSQTARKTPVVTSQIITPEGPKPLINQPFFFYPALFLGILLLFFGFLRLLLRQESLLL